MTEPATIVASVFAVLFGLLYFRERGRSRDYATDLSQLINDYDLGRDDLRRSLKWDEIEQRVKP